MGLFRENMAEPCAQARAVRHYLDMWDGVQCSWDESFFRHAPVSIAEWHNCRERGFVIMFDNKDREQLNIAFFQHRNSDNICAIEWVQNTLNPPTIESAKFGDVYKDKYDVSFEVECGEVGKMGDWIIDRLETHYASTSGE